jgi:hypothetical protein
MADSMDETSELTERLHELKRTADEGESAETPLIVLGAVWVVAAAAVLVLIAIALLAYDLAK